MTISVESERAEARENFTLWFGWKQFMAISDESERTEGQENFRIFGFVKNNFMAISVVSESAEGR